jgi:hypothetical protein
VELLDEAGLPAARLGPAAEAGDTPSTGSADTRSPASAAAAIRRYVFLIAFLYLLIGNGRDEGGALRARKGLLCSARPVAGIA